VKRLNVTAGSGFHELAITAEQGMIMSLFGQARIALRFPAVNAVSKADGTSSPR
jgi:hypothetical protein